MNFIGLVFIFIQVICITKCSAKSINVSEVFKFFSKRGEFEDGNDGYGLKVKIFNSNPNYQLPASWDWREKGFNTPVSKQGICGGCWAFSIAGSIEGSIFVKTQKNVKLAAAELIDCAKDWTLGGCQGGHLPAGFNYIIKNGITEEKNYPYKYEYDFIATNQCGINQNMKKYKITGMIGIKSGDTRGLMEALVRFGPISIGINVGVKIGNEFKAYPSYLDYKTGIWDPVPCASDKNDHAVLLVGYGTSPEGKDYWIIKNSLGSNRGINGYYLLKRNGFENKCGISSFAWLPYIDQKDLVSP